MRIIGVVDLKGGQVVHGRAGRRQDYQPVRSLLTPSSQPLDIAQAFRDRLGLLELYIADLDAIAGAPPCLATYGALQTRRFRLWVDAGVHDLAEVQSLLEAGIERIVVGLETIAGPEALAAIIDRCGTERIAFSLDLMAGQPLGDLSRWHQPDARSIATQAIRLGVRHVIVLDLAQVGCDAGTGTEDLCRELAIQHSDVEIVAGGGIRGINDLRHLEDCGVRAALVASALHDGRLGADDLASLSQIGLTDRGAAR